MAKYVIDLNLNDDCSRCPFNNDKTLYNTAVVTDELEAMGIDWEAWSR